MNKETMRLKKAQSMDRQPRYGMRKLSVGLASCMLGFMLYASPTAVQAAETELEETTVAKESSQEDDSKDSATDADSEVTDDAAPLTDEATTEKEGLTSEENEMGNEEEIAPMSSSDTSNVTVGDIKIHPDTAKKCDESGCFIVIKRREYIDKEGNKYESTFPYSTRTYYPDEVTDSFSPDYDFEETSPATGGVEGYKDSTPGDFKLVNEPYVEYGGRKYYARNSQERLKYIPGERFTIEYRYQKEIVPGTVEEYNLYQLIDKKGKVIKSEKEEVQSVKGVPGYPVRTKGWVSNSTGEFHQIDGKERFFKLVEIRKSKNADERINTVIDQNAALTIGIKSDETQRVTFVYQHELGEGTFKERHVYQTIGRDNSTVPEKTITIEEELTGNEYETYTTQKKDKAGYKLDNVNGKSNVDVKPAYNKDGNPATGNFVEYGYQELTYIYKKYLPGTFEERHIYQDVDENNVVIKEEIISNKSEGIPTEEYTTQKNNTKKDEGYVFKEAKAEAFEPMDSNGMFQIYRPNDAVFDKDGKEIKGKYKSEENHRVDYIYQKKVQTRGSFIEEHVYQVFDEDGKKLDGYGFVESYETSGYDEEYVKPSADKVTQYTTQKNEKDGFELVNVSSTDEEAIYNKDGSEATGSIIGGKDLKVTYTYRKDIVTRGTYTLKHVYQTLDEDGEVISESVNEDTIEGYSGDMFFPEIEEKDGYLIKEYEIVDGPVYEEYPEYKPEVNWEDKEIYGYYVPGYNQEIIFIYQKSVITKGSFVEKHVYQILDEDGQLISESEEESTMIGKEPTTYTTKAQEKDGFELVDVKGERGATYHQDGSKAVGRYVAQKSQAVTYTYQKTVVTKGTFYETHIYVDVDEDGNVLGQHVVHNEVIGKGGTQYTANQLLEEGYYLVAAQVGDAEAVAAEAGAVLGDYIAGATQNVTYTYQKQVSTIRYVKEILVYQEVDEEGNVLSETSYSRIISSKRGRVDVLNPIAKDGYNLVDIRWNDGTEEGLKGELDDDRYFKEPYQEVTYTYQKVKEEPKKLVASVPMLPETGEADAEALFTAASLSILAGLGLVAGRRKEDEAL